MKVADAQAMAKNAGPHPRKIFIPRSDWNELWIDLRDNYPHVFPSGLIRWITNARFDALHVFSAETDDWSIIREVNRQADEDFRRSQKDAGRGQHGNP